VFWVDLQGYSGEGLVSAGAVLSPLLRQLGVEPHRIPEQVADQAVVYDRALRDLAEAGQPVLLVLDNVSTVDQLHGLLPAHGRHRALITTRDTLALPGARRLLLDVLPDSEAVMVLERVLRRQEVDDDRITTDPTGAVRLAKACGELPLALLIAAGLLVDEPDLTPGALAEQLTGTSADSFTHGETRLTTVFTASYDRLHAHDPDAARLLRLLALAPGADIGTDAAAALAGAPQDRTRILLRVLRQAHLLTAGTVDRWRMHDLVRRHTLDHTFDDDTHHDGEVALTRLLDYYLHTAVAADTHVRTQPGDPVNKRFTDRADALVWLDSAHPNLVAAIRSAVTTGRHTHAVHLAIALDEYLAQRCYLVDRFVVHSLVLDSVLHLGDPHTAATVYTNLGIALFELRKFDVAVTAHKIARDIFADLVGRRYEATAWNNLGLALRKTGQLNEAVAAHRTALDIYRQFDDRHGEGTAWGNLGLVLEDMGRFDEAATAHQHNLDIVRDLGDRHREGMAANNLGLVLKKTGRLDEAIAAHRRARDIYHDFEDAHNAGMAWNNLGLALQAVQRFEEATTAHDVARGIFRDHRDLHREGTALANLGSALAATQRFDEARSSWELALVAFRHTGDTSQVEQVTSALELLSGEHDNGT
jgi:tetratricopeptide (TPR) repeat protein